VVVTVEAGRVIVVNEPRMDVVIVEAGSLNVVSILSVETVVAVDVVVVESVVVVGTRLILVVVVVLKYVETVV
jgi:hypothetical protein